MRSAHTSVIHSMTAATLHSFSSHTLSSVYEEEWEDGGRDTGDTPLHYLAKAGDVQAVNNLLEGMSQAERWEAVHARNSLGSTALHVAAYYGRQELVNTLMDIGANPWQRNRVGWHTGHYAARWSQPTDLRLTIAARPGPASTASDKFSFSHIRKARKVNMESVEARKARLQCDSGISVLGSEESLMV